MALKSTVYKASLSIADIDHGYYADHTLTLARHPSETDERMMIRLAALVMNAHTLQTICSGDGVLGFGAGLSDPNDPDVFLKDFTEKTRLWVEVGQPDEKPLLKACQKSDLVKVYAFNHATEVWWRAIEGKLTRLEKLEVWQVTTEASAALAKFAQRNMQLQATVLEGTLSISDGVNHIGLDFIRRK